MIIYLCSLGKSLTGVYNTTACQQKHETLQNKNELLGLPRGVAFQN